MGLSKFDHLTQYVQFRVQSFCGDREFRGAFLHSVMGWKDITITTAQMLTLNTVPVSLVAAPGAGLALVPVQLFSTLTYNSAAYSTNASGASVKYTDGSGVAPGLTLTQAFLQSSANSSLNVMASATAYIPTANAPLMLVAASSDPTTGNSALKVRIYYRIVPSPLPTY